MICTRKLLPYSSDDDDDLMSSDAPRSVKGHATYGDAEFFYRKVSRLMRSGKYARYDLKAQIAQISTLCDDTIAGRLDDLHSGSGVGHPVMMPWVAVLGAPAQRADHANGIPEMPAVQQQNATDLKDFIAWFIASFSK